MTSTTYIDGIGHIKFNSDDYKTPAGAAKGFYKALTEACKKEGIYCDAFITPPDKTSDYVDSESWRVCWESGAYEWAITASMNMGTRSWYAEPYYSFDLCFRTP